MPPKGKANRKMNKDKKQDARINRLEKMIPTVNEVVHFSNTVATVVLTEWQIKAPYPSALHTEKVVLKGITNRLLFTIQSPDSVGNFARVVSILYKCSVDYTQSPPVVTSPAVADVFASASALEYINPDNRNRIIVLRDQTKYINNNTLNTIAFNQNKNFGKNGRIMKPTTDNAFVWRPFVLYYQNQNPSYSPSNGMSSGVETISTNTHLEQLTEMRTVQLPA